VKFVAAAPGCGSRLLLHFGSLTTEDGRYGAKREGQRWLLWLGQPGRHVLIQFGIVSDMVVYAIIFGISMGIQFIAIGNLYPDYFGVSEFPKIMGYTMPFNTFISALGAPIAGYIRDKTGSYVPAFRVLLVLLAISFFCILFAKPPVHPSLKGKVRVQEPEAQPTS
jgi:MFS family permease